MADAPEPHGPTLRTYVETRFNLLMESVQHSMEEMELRHQQRFEASEKAIALGFSGQKLAVDAAFAAQREAITAALAAADRAVTKAELATEKRFESVNEFRGTLDNQQRTLIPRSEVDVLVKGLEEKISNVTKVTDKLESDVRERKSEARGVKDGYGWAAAALMLVIALAAFALRLAGK